MAILYRILPSNGKVFHGYAWIHFVFFLGFIPWFYTFPTKTPPCRFPAGDGTGGAALLTNRGETAIIKAERALLLVVSLSESYINKFYADRLAATERSARFYGQVYKTPLRRVLVWGGAGGGALDKLERDCYHKNRKSAVTSGWLFVSANNNIMLTVQLPLGGQHAFMDKYITPPASGPGLGRRS